MVRIGDFFTSFALALVAACTLTAAETRPLPVIPDPIGLGPRLALIDYLQETMKVQPPAEASMDDLVTLYWQAQDKIDAKKADEVTDESLQRDRLRRLRRELAERYQIKTPEDASLETLEALLRKAQNKHLDDSAADLAVKAAKDAKKRDAPPAPPPATDSAILSAPGAPAGVITGNRMLHQASGFSVAIPDGWKPAAVGEGGPVLMAFEGEPVPGDKCRFTIAQAPVPAIPAEAAELVKAGLAQQNPKWTFHSDGKIATGDGAVCYFVSGIAPAADGSTYQDLHCFVPKDATHSFVVSFACRAADYASLAPEFQAMVGSIKVGK